MDPRVNLPATDGSPPSAAASSVHDLGQQQKRLLEALYEIRISTTNIWRRQGFYIALPPRRTIQQEAQGPMDLVRRSSDELQWVEPGATLLGNEPAEDSVTLAHVNRRLRATLVQEVGNVADTPPLRSSSPNTFSSSAAAATLITPTTTPTRKALNSSLRREYAEYDGLGGCPLPESPPPRPNFKDSLPSPESGAGARTPTRSSRGKNRKTPYPKRTASSAAIFESSPPSAYIRAGTPFVSKTMAYAGSDDDVENAEDLVPTDVDELPTVSSVVGVPEDTEKSEARD